MLIAPHTFYSPGMQLRSEDPVSLKQIIALTTSAAAAASGRVAGAAAAARIDFLSDVCCFHSLQRFVAK
jgi:hypothetical protein